MKQTLKTEQDRNRSDAVWNWLAGIILVLLMTFPMLYLLALRVKEWWR